MPRATLATYGISYLSARETGHWPLYTIKGQTITASTLQQYFNRPAYREHLSQFLSPEAMRALEQHVAKHA